MEVFVTDFNKQHCVVAVGTETDGSILSSAAACGLVGLKPGLGKIGTAGIVPLAHSQDTAGPMARMVQDCTLLYQALKEDVADRADFLPLNDLDALKGTRVGVLRHLFDLHRDPLPVFEGALHALRGLGITLVEDIQLPDMAALGEAELEVLLYEFNMASICDAKRLCKQLAWTEGLETIIRTKWLVPRVSRSLRDRSRACRSWRLFSLARGVSQVYCAMDMPWKQGWPHVSRRVMHLI